MSVRTIKHCRKLSARGTSPQSPIKSCVIDISRPLREPRRKARSTSMEPISDQMTTKMTLRGRSLMTVSNRLHLTDVEWGVLISFFKLAPPRLVAESLFTWTKGIEGSKLLMEDRKSTRLNSSHSQISYPPFSFLK